MEGEREHVLPENIRAICSCQMHGEPHVHLDEPLYESEEESDAE